MSTRRNLVVGGGALALGGAAFATAYDMGSLEDYEASVAVTRARLGETPALADLIRYASLAPSGHNAQPWKFRADGKRLEIIPDYSRRTPIVDPDDHHLFVSLGCAAENLALACKASGHPAEVSFDPVRGGRVLFELGDNTPRPSPLLDAIVTRQSTRTVYEARPVSTADLKTLVAISATPGVDLVLISDHPQQKRVSDLVVAGNSAQMSDQAFVRELRTWLRFSPKQALQTGDGLFSVTTGNPVLPAWLGTTFFDLAFKTSAENDKYVRQIASSAGIAVFCAQNATPEHWVHAGRAAQRFALQATALGLKHAFINQPVEVADLRPELAKLIGLPGRRPDLVMRFGYGPALPYSARRPVSAVLA